MRNALLHLGRTPRMRRIVAGLILLGCAVIVTFMHRTGNPVGVDLAINCVAASLALGLLHLRWRARERREITPAKAEDIFS
jgi:hypothetical protein